METSPGGKTTLDPSMRKLVELAKQDLASKLAVSEADIETLQADRVTWRDSSAGCPQPDLQYLQVLTGGARIVLTANKASYYYHSRGDGRPFLCENPSPIDPLPYGDGVISPDT